MLHYPTVDTCKSHHNSTDILHTVDFPTQGDTLFVRVMKLYFRQIFLWQKIVMNDMLVSNLSATLSFASIHNNSYRYVLLCRSPWELESLSSSKFRSWMKDLSMRFLAWHVRALRMSPTYPIVWTNIFLIRTGKCTDHKFRKRESDTNPILVSCTG